MIVYVVTEEGFRNDTQDSWTTVIEVCSTEEGAESAVREAEEAWKNSPPRHGSYSVHYYYEDFEVDDGR